MRRQQRAAGLAVAVMLLVSCAKSAVETPVVASADAAAQEAKTSDIVLTGTRIPAPVMAERADSLAMISPVGPPPPPPPPPAPGMYVQQNWSPPYHDVGRDKFTH